MALIALIGSMAWAAACDERLTGHVDDGFTGQPISGARVEVAGPDGALLGTATTLGDGVFVVRGLCAGPHGISVLAQGFEPLTAEITVPDDHLDLVLLQVLEEIVVTAPSFSAEDTRAGATLSGDELERTRGDDLARALSRIPGVTVLRGTADVGKPVVRGLFGRRLLVLQDRVRHEGQSWGLDHAPEVDPFGAAELTVVKGPSGVRWGSDAVGGVVLVDPAPLRTDPGHDGELHAIAGSNGSRATVAGRLDGAVPGGFAWRVEGDLANSAARSTPDHVLGNTASQQSNVALGAGISRERWNARVSWRHHDFAGGVCYCVTSDSPDAFFAQAGEGRPRNAGLWTTSYDVDRPFQRVTHDLVLVRTHALIGDGAVFQATWASQLNRRREYDQARASIEGPQFDFTLGTHSLDLSFEHSPGHLGSRVTTRGAVGAAGSLQTNVYAGLPLIPNFRALTGGVFGYERFSFGDAAIEVGTRYDRERRRTWLTPEAFARHEARGTLGPDDCELSPQSASCLGAWDALTATVGGIWRPLDDRLDLKLDVSSAGRFPDSDELFLNGVAPTFPVYGLGAPDLRTETTWGSSATVHVHLDGLVGEVSGFLNRVDRYVNFAPELGPSGQPVIDVLSRGAFPRFTHEAVNADYRGADGGLWIAPEGLISLGLQGSIVRGTERGTGEPLAFVPADRALVELAVQRPSIGPLGATRVAVSVQGVARQTRVDPGSAWIAAPAGYALLGAFVGTEVPLGPHMLALAVDGQNLLDERYREYTSLLRYYADEPGRDVRLRASLHFAI